jgi:hypothetical protein
MRESGDPSAVALAAKYKTVRMPGLSLSDNDAADLISYVEAMTYAEAASKAAPQLQHEHH